MENVFLTFREPSDKQKIWGEVNAGEKEGKKGQRCKAPGMVKASDKRGQVSAGAHSLLKIYTSFWQIPQPLGEQCPPCRFLLTTRDSRLPRRLCSCLPLDYL